MSNESDKSTNLPMKFSCVFSYYILSENGILNVKSTPISC